MNYFIWFVLLFSSSIAFAEKEHKFYEDLDLMSYYSPGYDDGYDDPDPPQEYKCSLKVDICVDKSFKTRSNAWTYADLISDIFGGMSDTLPRVSKYEGKWRVEYEKAYLLYGSGYNWMTARRDVHREYYYWSEHRGYGYDFVHRLTFVGTCG